jgi:hypothetical protein
MGPKYLLYEKHTYVIFNLMSRSNPGVLLGTDEKCWKLERRTTSARLRKRGNSESALDGKRGKDEDQSVDQCPDERDPGRHPEVTSIVHAANPGIWSDIDEQFT